MKPPGLRLSRHPPRYPVPLWNQYDSVIEGTSRTNNVIEGWHDRFQLVVGKSHLSLYAFLEELLKEQVDSEIMLRQLQMGQRIRIGLDKNRREIEERMLTIVGEYYKYAQTNDVLSYLRHIGHCLRL